jgi:hypothetical protein
VSYMERYLSEVGAQTYNIMKVTLYALLKKRYEDEYESKFAVRLAGAVANYLFCDQPAAEAGAEGRSFATQNEALIATKARELARDEALCRALTCAVYNFCYGKYVDSGRKVGLVLHPFLGCVRALQAVIDGKEPVSILDGFYTKVGRDNVEPLLRLWQLGLYRRLPYLPDSKVIMDEVALFRDSVPSAAALFVNRKEP